MDVRPGGPRRYELKYTIPEQLARAIRDHIQPLFSPDPHATADDGRYVVNSLYLDTPGLRFYYDTKFRKLTRLKLRVRYYGTYPDRQLFLEAKHRHDTVLWKRRRPIPAAQWPGVLQVARSEQTPPTIVDMPETFEELTHLYAAAPVLRVRYSREAYVSDTDEYGRITFDRSLRYRLAPGSTEIEGSDEDMVGFDDPVTAQWDDSPVILEIKTKTFVPSWAIAIIRRFSLVQRGFSKYCYAIDRYLEDGRSVDELAL